MNDEVSAPSRISSFLRKPAVWFTGFVVALAAVFSGLNTIAREARDLPGEWGKTAEELSSWYYEYHQWEGHWTSKPEGWADFAQWKLSEEPLQLDLEVNKDGTVVGRIENTGICENIPIFEFLLVEGELTGPNSADLEAWDLVDGYRRVFASFEVERDGFIMEVRPKNDPAGIFTAKARIGRDTDEFLGENPIRESVCAGKRNKTIQDMMGKSQRD